MSGKPAARLSDPTACLIPGHGTNPIATGSGDVFINGLAAARLGDVSVCGGAMSSGLANTVLINGKPAVTTGSAGTHGNRVMAGSGSVCIGDSHSLAPCSEHLDRQPIAANTASTAAFGAAETHRVL